MNRKLLSAVLLIGFALVTAPFDERSSRQGGRGQRMSKGFQPNQVRRRARV
jgi:hypothetical protein